MSQQVEKLREIAAQLEKKGKSQLAERLLSVVEGAPKKKDAKPSAQKSKVKKGTLGPGSLSLAAREVIGEEVSALFDITGQQTYGKIVGSIKSAIDEAADAGQTEIKRALREQYGAVGLNKYSGYLGEWKKGVIEAVFQHGMEDLEKESVAEDQSETTTTASALVELAKLAETLKLAGREEEAKKVQALLKDL